LDHAETLAAILPWLSWYKREQKKEKLLQYGERVLGIKSGTLDARIDQTILATAAFFQSVGMPTTLSSYGVDPDEAAEIIQKRFEKRGTILGEHNDIDGSAAAAIVRMSR
jgi:NADP-dependent alcohol dehydrogenase